MAPPIGSLDVVKDNGDGTITVQGWAVDMDEPTKAIEAHIYVGEKVYGVVANKARSDVNDVLQVSGDHGIDEVVKIVDVVNVMLYGIDSSGDPSQNSFIGSKKVVVERP